MLSKTSFFNLTLFKKDLSRSWPLWGGITAVGCLGPLYVLLTLLNNPTLQVTPSDLGGVLYPAAVYFAPGAAFGYAILVAMVVWSYLYNARAVGLMHTLPLRRSTLFVTHILSGLAMLLIPYAVVGGFTCMLALCWGFMDLTAVLTAVASVLLVTVLFFGLATLCAMATGNIFALPAFYLVVNFIAPAADALVTLLSRSFLVGISSDYTGVAEFLSPLVQIYRKFYYEGTYVSGDVYEHRVTGFGTVIVYGLVGLVFFALAWQLYRRRVSECAGSVVAFRWLRPVFRFGLALAFALTAGQALYALIWGNIFQRGGYAQALPMAVSMALTGLVGYYAASMLLDKTLRVFRGSLPGAAAAVLAAAAVCVFARVDVLGLENWVPQAQDIDSVRIYTSNMLGETPDISPVDDPLMAEKALALHRAITADIDRVRYMDGRVTYSEDDELQQSFQRVEIYYSMADGRWIRRSYALTLEKDLWQADAGIEGAFKSLFAGSDLQLLQVEKPVGSELSNAHVYCYDDERPYTEKEFTVDEQALYTAVLADARAGRLYAYDPFDSYKNNEYPVSIDLEFRYREEDSRYEGYSYDYRSLSLRPTMTETVRCLVAQGFITAEDLLRWNEQQGLTNEIAAKYGMVVPEVVYEREGAAAVIGGADGPTSVFIAR